MINILKNITVIGLLLVIFSCKSKPTNDISQKPTKPIIKENGKFISFPLDTVTLNFFKTQIVKNENIEAEIKAPARVVATVIESNETKQNLILFDNPDLTTNYTALLQHSINITQYKLNLERIKDLASNGAATGKDLIEAQTVLANEQAAVIEHEAKLKLAGFNPQALQNAKANNVWVICDIPENQLEKINIGSNCSLLFSSYPEQPFTGKIESLGDVVDNITRMVKVRIAVQNPNGKLKAGMYAIANFGVSVGKFLSIPKSALVTVQSENYVFIKKSDNEFERKKVTTGQQIDDKIIVFSGLNQNDIIVIEGVMQLKGISFGY